MTGSTGRRSVGILLGVLLCGAASATATDEGFSAAAKKVGCGGYVSYPAPDGSKRLISAPQPDGDSALAVLVAGRRLDVDYPAWPCPEALWSPDSKALLLTYSTGGLVGTFETRVYVPSAAGISSADPAAAVRQDFLRDYPRCFEPESPNIVGVAWLAPSRLLVAAQVLPRANCDRMGTFSTYEVEWPSGRIVQKHNQIESKRRFGRLLGAELRRADDGCERDPMSCRVPALHGR